MAKHLVTCRACKERFDAQLSGADVEWVMPSKGWYYHKSCYENMRKGNLKNDNEWKRRIYDFIAHDLKVSYDFYLCEAQLKKFVEKDKIGTYKGIFYTLKYFYEIRNGDWTKGHGGLGIVPFVYKEATDYWKNRENRERGTLAKIEEQIKIKESQEKISLKKSQSSKKKKEKWNLEEIE